MGSLIGLIFGGGLVIAMGAIFTRKHPENRIDIPENFWAQWCDDLAAGIRAGLSISESTWLASGSLPVLLQAKFLSVRDEFKDGESFSKKLSRLSQELKNPTFTKIEHLISISQNQNSAAIASILNEFSQNLRTDIALVNEIAGKQAVTRVSARVAAIAPVVILGLTSTRTTVREAFLSTSGLLVIAGTMTITIISYLMMRSISRIKVLNDR